MSIVIKNRINKDMMEKIQKKLRGISYIIRSKIKLKK